MHYFIEIHSNKAKEDINHLVRRLGYRNLAPAIKSSSATARFTVKLLGVARILTRMKRGDVLFLQYPMKKFYRTACLLARLRGAKVVTVVHDLGAFRRHKLTCEQERRRLELTDFLIVHNERMKAHLLAHGSRMPLFCLDIFDYLSASAPFDHPVPDRPSRVVYAGGLGPQRNGFLYELDRHVEGWTLQLYGRGVPAEAADRWKNIKYRGFVASEDFIAGIEADFGLVWDGHSIDECNGDWGEYLKVNNPHKTSFYLRAGLPVIVWNRAAMAPFVEREGIGFSVGSLREIGDRLARLTPGEYAAMRRAARTVGTRLGEGFYTRRALRAADEKIGCVEPEDE